MPYSVSDPIELQKNLEAAVRAGEISPETARAASENNLKKINQNWNEAQKLKREREAASQAEKDRNNAEAARQQYEADAEGRRERQASLDRAKALEALRRNASSQSRETESAWHKYNSMNGRVPSGGVKNLPTGESNDRSGDSISGVAPKRPVPAGTGGNDIGGGGGGSSRPSGTASNQGAAPVLEKTKPIFQNPWGDPWNDPPPKAKNGELSGVRQPVNSPGSGGAARPTPSSPNYRPSQNPIGAGQAAGQIIGDIQGTLGQSYQDERIRRAVENAGGQAEYNRLSPSQQADLRYEAQRQLDRDLISAGGRIPLPSPFMPIANPIGGGGLGAGAGAIGKAAKGLGGVVNPDWFKAGDPSQPWNNPEGGSPSFPSPFAPADPSMPRPYGPLPFNPFSPGAPGGGVENPTDPNPTKSGIWTITISAPSVNSKVYTYQLPGLSTDSVEVRKTSPTAFGVSQGYTSCNGVWFRGSAVDGACWSHAPLAVGATFQSANESEPNQAPRPSVSPAPGAGNSPIGSPSPGANPIPSSAPVGSSAPSPDGESSARPSLSPENVPKPSPAPGFSPGFRSPSAPSPIAPPVPQPAPGPQPWRNPAGNPGPQPIGGAAPDPSGSPSGNPFGSPSGGTGSSTQFKGGADPSGSPQPDPTPAPGGGTGTGTGTGNPPSPQCRYPNASSVSVGVFDGFDNDGNPKVKNQTVSCLPSESARVQLAFKRLFELEAKKIGGDIAFPEAWAVRRGIDRPQLVIIYGEIYSSGKLSSSRWSVSVPHYRGTSKSKISAPSYKRGNWQGQLTLNDGSTIVVNANSSEECKRSINKLKILVPNEYRLKDGKAIKPRVVENPNIDLKVCNVVPVMAKYYATGQKDMAPTWSQSLRR